MFLVKLLIRKEDMKRDLFLRPNGKEEKKHCPSKRRKKRKRTPYYGGWRIGLRILNVKSPTGGNDCCSSSSAPVRRWWCSARGGGGNY